MHTHDYLQERAMIKNNQYKADYDLVFTAFDPAIVFVAGQIHQIILLLVLLLPLQLCQCPNLSPMGLG